MTVEFNADQARKNAESAHFNYDKIISDILYSVETASKLGERSATFQYQTHVLGAEGTAPIKAELNKRGFNFEASVRDAIVVIVVSF